MISCSVCNTLNHHLAVSCSSCGGFIQARIDNLDLFSTAWAIIERPASALRTVALARYKNYIIILSAVAGIGFAYSFFWMVRAGESSGNLFNLIAAGLVLGPPLGLLLVLLFSLLVVTISAVFRERISFRNCFAITSYALIPVVLSLALVFPIEILTFGYFFFTRTPTAYSLKPLSYVIMIGLDTVFAIWSVVLIILGVRVLLDTHWKKALAISTSAFAVLGGVLLIVYHFYLAKVFR